MTEGLSTSHDIKQIEAILGFCSDIEDMISVYGSDIEDFLDNKHFQYACAFATSQIGERVKRLSLELTSGHSEVDWKVIARFRDLLSHGYESVNLRVFWDTTINDIPKLRKECELILTELRRNDKN